MQLPADLLFAYFMSVFALACSPGVASAALARNTLHKGEAAGVNMAMGILIARLTKTLLAVVSLAHLADLFAVAEGWLKLGGAAYLSFVGCRVLFGRRCCGLAKSPPGGPGRQLLNGFLLSWSNPSALFFIIIVLPRFVDHSLQIWQQLLVLGIIWALVALIVELMLVACAARYVPDLPARVERLTRILLGTLLISMGIWIAADIQPHKILSRNSVSSQPVGTEGRGLGGTKATRPSVPLQPRSISL